MKFSIRRIERIGRIDKLARGSLSLMRCNFRMENTICQIKHNIFHSPNRTNKLNPQTYNCKGSLSLMRRIVGLKILCLPKRTNRSNRQASNRVPKYREIFLSVANECKWEIENSTWRIVPKMLYSPNRTNRAGRIELVFFSDRI